MVNSKPNPGNSLADTHPELAAQADGWDPIMLRAGSNKKVDWRCEYGHTWSAIIANRSRGSDCPFCSNSRIWIGFNDLATTHPELAAQADGWDPTCFTRGSNKKAKWKCGEGHEWTTSIGERTSGDANCPACTGNSRRLIPGYSDLASRRPDLAAEAYGRDASNKTFGSGERVQWKCAEGHIFRTTINNRSSQDWNCPICANRKLLTGYNDLRTTHLLLSTEMIGDPTQVMAGAKAKVLWRCSIGHTYQASVKERTSDHATGCPICSGLQVLVGFNDLATLRPNIASEASGWDPSTVTVSSGKKKRWICEMGHKWWSTVAGRSDGHGCPSCAYSGFDPNRFGWLYLIDHFDFHMFQIGISNFPDYRLKDHKRRGWEVIEIRGPMDGHLTRKLETDCLHALEKRGAILGHKAGIDKFDGYTEAWTKQSLNVTSIKQILDWVYEDEGVKS